MEQTFLFALFSLQSLTCWMNNNNKNNNNTVHGVMTELWGAPAFYFYLLLVGVGLPTLIDMAGLFSQRLWLPTYRDLIQTDPRYPKHPERRLCCCGSFKLEESDLCTPDDMADAENSVVESPLPTIKSTKASFV